mmetsp:Transcript_47283/g.64365  ORF Transcript_47283/g.64365 Transcript_47283/m.64365 type:complete len:177 (+) Transcript_47283:405-935(+)
MGTCITRKLSSSVNLLVEEPRSCFFAFDANRWIFLACFLGMEVLIRFCFLSVGVLRGFEVYIPRCRLSHVLLPRIFHLPFSSQLSPEVFLSPYVPVVLPISHAAFTADAWGVWHPKMARKTIFSVFVHHSHPAMKHHDSGGGYRENPLPQNDDRYLPAEKEDRFDTLPESQIAHDL